MERDKDGKVTLLLGIEVEGICNKSDGGCGRVHIVLVGQMLAEKEAIIVWVGFLILVLSLVTSLSP